MRKKSRYKTTKKKAQTAHAEIRFGQREGFLFSKNIKREFIKNIQKNKDVKFLWRQSCRVTVWKIWYLNNEYTVVYDKTRKNIVTVLPKDAE